MSNPYDFHDAFNKTVTFHNARKQAIEDYEAALEKAAEAKFEYRKAKATAYLTAAAEGGTADAKKVRAEELAAEAERARDIAEGMVRAAKERLDAVESDRAMANQLIQWSMRLAPMGVKD